MIKKITIFTFLTVLLTGSLSASLINFTSGTGFAGALQADGVSTISSAGAGSFSFQLGTFNEASLSGNSDTWAAGFNNEMAASNPWSTSAPAANRFQGSVSMDDGSSTNNAAYIFGFNTSDSSQIILFKNAAWVFPAFDETDFSADTFSLADANTQVLQANGTFTAIGGNFQMLSAVPEPSTYAALAGMFVLCIAMLRRRT
jgi:hypothetical protein